MSPSVRLKAVAELRLWGEFGTPTRPLGGTHPVTELRRRPRGATKEPPLSVALFYAFAAFTVLSAAGVAFSKNILYSAFALLGTLFGVAALYVFLAADFVAGAQFLIYIGGVLVLILFAVMLTNRIADVAVSNRSVGACRRC